MLRTQFSQRQRQPEPRDRWNNATGPLEHRVTVNINFSRPRSSSTKSYVVKQKAVVGCAAPMKIENVSFCTTDWSTVATTEHPGEIGKATWRTVELGNIRVRMVEYSPGYLADHWCQRGHVVLVIEGELHTELKDGRRVTLMPGQSYQVADGAEAHRSAAPNGARIFIVD
jgi:hypothetical protein